MNFQSPEEVHSWLDDLPKFSADGERAADFDLDRFRDYCDDAGNPQEGFSSVHVAGTNGKGSTCALIASVYRQAGYSVGLYTSPHLNRFNERFRINGEMLPDDEMLVFFQQQGELIREYGLTYFEISTALSFWWFNRSRVDLAVIETGLGGRLDATNVLRPRLSVITNISLDHTVLLGPTIGRIAREKAGIIKEGTPVLTGNMDGEAREVIGRIAADRDSPLYGIDELDFSLEEGRFRVKGEGKIFEAAVGTLAPVQANNLAMAYRCAGILEGSFPVGELELRRGLERAPELFPTPARFEKLHPDLDWYFDGAHNREAIRALKEAVRAMRPVSEAVAVFSMMKDKASEEAVREFSEFKKIYYHSSGAVRSAPADHVISLLPEVKSLPSEEKALQSLLKELETELVIFTGSFYFYGTIREWLNAYIVSR